MSDWKAHFKVKIPIDLSPQTCIEIDKTLIELYEEASFLKAEVEARLAACKGTGDDQYRARYTELVASYEAKGQKLPAKDTLIALAENSLGDVKNATTHAEIELDFFKEILSNLSNTRKLIENITLQLATEAKALQNGRYLDIINLRSKSL
jgi:hypothetical protein